jgi:hypothetical protein
MKKISFYVACMLIAFVSTAQSHADEIGLIQHAYGMDKKELIAAHMKLTEAEASKFWPIYDAYEVDRKEYGKKRLNLIEDYANNYTTLSNEKATELLNTTLSNQTAFLKLQKNTFKKMAKQITAIRAAQFVQVEMYLENVIRLSLNDEIPLIGEIDLTKKK